MRKQLNESFSQLTVLICITMKSNVDKHLILMQLEKGYSCTEGYYIVNYMSPAIVIKEGISLKQNRLDY